MFWSWAPTARAAELACNELPVDQQQLCERVRVCTMISDAGLRAECFDAVFASRERQRSAPEPRPPAVIATPTPESRPPAVIATPAPAPAPEVTPGPVRPSRPAPSRLEDTGAGVRTEEVATQKVTVGKRFSGVVKAVRELMHDRQLVALDNGLLFEGEGARGHNLSVGDEVTGARVSRFGQRYLVGVPSRRTFEMTRVRCERIDRTRDTIRKCSLLEE